MIGTENITAPEKSMKPLHSLLDEFSNLFTHSDLELKKATNTEIKIVFIHLLDRNSTTPH